MRNFRGIADVDVTVPEGKQIICLVGPNGGGKSALMSLMVKALQQLTAESTPDLAKGVLGNERPRHPRNLSGVEVGRNGSAHGVRTDWVWRGQAHQHFTSASRARDDAGFAAL